MQVNILKLNETEHWSAEAQAAAGGRPILSVYLYTPEIGYHLCESTRSYELHLVGFTTDGFEGSDEEWEKLGEVLQDGLASSEPVSYMHAWRVEAFPKLDDCTDRAAGWCKLDDYDTDDQNEAIDDAREYVLGNGFTD